MHKQFHPYFLLQTSKKTRVFVPCNFLACQIIKSKDSSLPLCIISFTLIFQHYSNKIQLECLSPIASLNILILAINIKICTYEQDLTIKNKLECLSIVWFLGLQVWLGDQFTWEGFILTLKHQASPKILQVTNGLAYFATASVTKQKVLSPENEQVSRENHDIRNDDEL